jgi:hypothetical protein
MQRLISSDMGIAAVSRRAVLGMTTFLHFIDDLGAQFHDRVQ